MSETDTPEIILSERSSVNGLSGRGWNEASESRQAIHPGFGGEGLGVGCLRVLRQSCVVAGGVICWAE